MAKSAHAEVRNAFLQHCHTVLEQDANLPMDEVFGTVLDNYEPVAESLIPVFPHLIEKYLAEHPEVVAKLSKARPSAGGPQGLKPDAARGSQDPSRDRTRQSEANRRGSTGEGSTASDNTGADTEAWKPELADQWADIKQREFLKRLG